MTASGPLGPVQLHHLLSVGLQEPGQAGPIATGALDRPHPPTVLSVGEPPQLLVASRGCRHGHLLNERPGGRGHDGGGVGVFVGVDPDDELDGVCQHVHRVDSLPGDDVDGSVRTGARQDCDETHPRDRVVKLLIRPAAPVPGRSRQQ
jgi:hypothetical protein